MLLFKNEPLSLGEQLSIWHEVIGKGVNLHERFNSPFRPSKSMSCSLHEYYGKILFGSFSEKDKPFVGWTAEKAHIFLKGTDFRHLLKYQKGYEVRTKTTSRIVPNYIDWDEESFSYWMSLGVNPINTIVKPINSYLIQKVTRPRLPAFCYDYPNEPKIYCPFESKTFKWRGMVRKNTTVFVKNNSTTLLVSKSYKDQLVAQSLFPTQLDYCHSQSEKYFFDSPLLDEVIAYPRKFTLYDNDDVGLVRGKEVAKEIGGKAIFVPEGKDLAEYYKIVGRKKTFQWLKENILK